MPTIRAALFVEKTELCWVRNLFQTLARWRRLRRHEGSHYALT